MKASRSALTKTFFTKSYSIFTGWLAATLTAVMRLLCRLTTKRSTMPSVLASSSTSTSKSHCMRSRLINENLSELDLLQTNDLILETRRRFDATKTEYFIAMRQGDYLLMAFGKENGVQFNVNLANCLLNAEEDKT